MTECHFALPGRNRCEVLSTWAAGVANARLLNVHERHGDLLKIATARRLLRHAVAGQRRHDSRTGRQVVPDAGGARHGPLSPPHRHAGRRGQPRPDGLDVTASRTGDRVFLHVVNTQRTTGRARLAIEGSSHFRPGLQLAADPEFEVFEHRPRCSSRSRRPAGRWPLDLPGGLGLGGGTGDRGRWGVPEA